MSNLEQKSDIDDFDPENPEWDDAMFERASFGQPLARRAGRPKSANPKQATTIRLSPEVIEHFKAGGKGWQTRIDEALKEYIAQGHSTV